jgi:signal transduction histidine kinase
MTHHQTFLLDTPDLSRQSPDDQRRYIQSMELLVKFVQDLSLARDLETITEIVRHAARELTHADGATFVLKDGDFCYYVDENAISPLWKGKRFPRSICIGGWCMRHRQPVVIEDVENDERIKIEAYRPTFIKSLVMVPIRTQDPIGAIGNYWATPHLATPEEIRLLQALADTTSVALENVQVYTELEQRVHDRTQDLKTANQELEAFAYTLSHDLRTPLTVLNGFSDLLDFKFARQLGNEGTRYIEHIKQAVQRINGQIEGMLSLHRAQHQPIQLQAINLSDMAREILADLQACHPNRSVECSIAPNLIAQGDPVLLRVVLENLFSNAWKYSVKTPHARIKLGHLDNPTTFYIKDNGAGFDMNRAEKLFQPFQRLHSAIEFEGNGIGLAAVARILDRHSGKIWAESVPNQGSTFFFTLPVSESSARQSF